MIHNGGDGSRVDGSLCLEGLDVVQRCRVKQLRGNKQGRLLAQLTVTSRTFTSCSRMEHCCTVDSANWQHVFTVYYGLASEAGDCQQYGSFTTNIVCCHFVGGKFRAHVSNTVLSMLQSSDVSSTEQFTGGSVQGLLVWI